MTAVIRIKLSYLILFNKCKFIMIIMFKSWNVFSALRCKIKSDACNTSNLSLLPARPFIIYYRDFFKTRTTQNEKKEKKETWLRLINLGYNPHLRLDDERERLAYRLFLLTISSSNRAVYYR
jgi:hypothetical protein